MWRQFKYSQFMFEPSPAFPDGHIASRPILRVDLLSGTQRFDCFAIIDSGADFCTFPLSFATELGLDSLVAKPSSSSGLGSVNVPTYYWNIRIELQKLVTFDVYAGFTEGLDAWGVGLLGQSGFFDRFPASFDLRNGLFQIDIP